MKKFPLLLSLIGLTACVGTEAPVTPQTEETVVAEPQEQKPTILETVQEIDQTLTEHRSPMVAAWFYSMTYVKGDTNICAYGDIPWNGDTSENTYEDNIAAFQIASDPAIKVECFVKNGDGAYYDSSDECILARRKAKKTTTCYFNYKKYLPADTKIKTDDDFLYLVKAFNALYTNSENPKECTYCENLQERTSAEKAACAKKAEKFLGQISSKTVPLCKNTVNKEYMQFLKDGISEFSFLSNMTQAEINSSVNSPSKAYLLRGIYASAYEDAWEQAIQNFGFTHFCSVSGYKNDIVNINKNSKKRTNKVVSLN